MAAISIHALREEGDVSPSKSTKRGNDFYPRPPRGGRPICIRFCRRVQPDFYPRPPRGGRPSVRSRKPRLCVFLSTPSARRATALDIDHCAVGQFLSTPSARRATIDRSTLRPLEFDFYPRPPRGGRPTDDHPPGRPFQISIHALREEGDVGADAIIGVRFQFLSTPSARRATRSDRWAGTRPAISIHALREEGDCFPHCAFIVLLLFLSTPSARRATCAADAMQAPDLISIHALREEGDKCSF